jgi:hypothetical protein
MAQVRLPRYEASRGDLPPVCMVCGAPASDAPQRTFSWIPTWVWCFIIAPLLFLIIALVTQRRMTIRTPLCDRHRNYWRWRWRIVWIGLIVTMVLGFATTGFLGDDKNQEAARTVGPFLCVGMSMVALVWFTAALIVIITSIGPSKITEDDIILGGVAQAFAAAVHEDLIELVTPEDDMSSRWEQRRESRKRRREDDRDQDPPEVIPEEGDDRLRAPDEGYQP